MKKLDKYKAQLLISLGLACLLLALESTNALLSVGGIVVAGAALGTGYYYWGYPRPQRYYWDEESQEYCYGYHARDLLRDRLMALWGRIRVPVQVTIAFGGLIAFVLLFLHNVGLFL